MYFGQENGCGKIWTTGANRGSNWSYYDFKDTLEAVGRVEMKGSRNGFKNRTIMQVRVARQQVVSLERALARYNEMAHWARRAIFQMAITFDPYVLFGILYIVGKLLKRRIQWSM